MERLIEVYAAIAIFLGMLGMSFPLAKHDLRGAVKVLAFGMLWPVAIPIVGCYYVWADYKGGAE